jgi:hypothetical protein
MSDYRAIAAVTATLQQMLQEVVQRAVPGALVLLGPPTNEAAEQAGAVVRIFLYRIDPNAHFRNMELPVRDAEGRLLQRPQMAVNLHYLLSFYGDESRLVPNLLVGAVLTFLHTQPAPSPATILSAEQAERAEGLQHSGLAEQARLLRFVLVPLDHDELSRLWTIFFQVPYVLSVVYRCEAILIEPELTPGASLPVRRTELGNTGMELPQIDSVVPQRFPYEAGKSLHIRGQFLGGPDTMVSVGGIDQRPRSVSQREIIVPLPPSIAAGVRTVQVRHAPPAPSTPLQRTPIVSNSMPFLLQPRIVGQPAFAGAGQLPPNANGESPPRVTVQVEPAAGQDQALALLLNEANAPEERPPRSYNLRPLSPNEGGDTLAFDASPVADGTYLVRVEVDRAASPLEVDRAPGSPTFGRYAAPTVVIG